MSRMPGDYSHGCIVRLKLTNFMHYSDICIEPLPGFNVIIGHNGSGKSAIVNAICVGLGGDIDTLQRTESISSLVRRGAKEARIEIELHNAEREASNWVVGSVFTERGKVSWTLSGDKVTKAKIEELVTQLNIQTSNMCQFLPQDVVKNFPLMSPQERFLNTVRAVGEGQLVDQFDLLKEHQSTIDNSNGTLITKQGTLEGLKNKLDQMSYKKDRHDEIDNIRTHKVLAEKKLKWKKFWNDIQHAKDLKKSKEVLDKEVQDLEKAIEKCVEVDKQKDAELDKLSELMKGPEATIQNTEAMMMEPVLKSKMVELEHIEQMITGEEEEKVDRQNSLKTAQAEVERIQRELKHCTSDTVLDNEIAKLRERENEINNKIHTLASSKTEMSQDLKSKIQSRKSLEKCVYDLRSAETQKLNQLNKSNPDCWGAVMHIRQNMKSWRQQGKFKSGVYEPAVLSLTVPNLDHSLYIEREAGSQQLEAFVCEDAREANILMEELRKQFNRVSVIHGDLNKLDQFQGPHGDKFRSRPRPEEMEKLKFVGFVGDMFSGPEAVKTHLFMHTGVFNTAVFAEETQLTSRISELFPNLRKYYVGKMLNTVKISKYSKQVSRTEDDVSQFRPQRFKINYDQEEIARLDSQIGNLSSEISILEKQIMRINDSEAKIRQELSQVKRDIAESHEAKQNKSKLEIALKMKKEIVEEYSKPFDFSKVKQFKEDKKKLTYELIKQTLEVQELLLKSSLQFIERDLLRKKQNHLHEKFSFNSNELAKLKVELKDKEKLRVIEHKKLEKSKDKLRESKDAAHSCTADESKDVQKKPPPGYVAKFETIEASDVEELEAYIDSLAKELKNEDKMIQEQVKFYKLYNERKESIERMEAEIEELKAKKDEALEASKEISTVGVQKLEDLLAKVNDKFSAYFASLGYSGQVCLSRKDPTDFKSYGVSIKLRFRDGEDWSELARGRQSGGEMSVTTAVYMLALQELTTVPFRCVDEINQGLDERNERKVWDMILAAATHGQGSQYFYLAPKMPYNLSYKPGTVVHLCHASDSIKRNISSVLEESEGRRWVEAAKKTKL